MGICSSNEKTNFNNLNSTSGNETNFKTNPSKISDLIPQTNNSINKNSLNKTTNNLKYPRGDFIFNKINNYQLKNNENDDNLSQKVELYISLVDMQDISSNYNVKTYLNNNIKDNNYQYLNQTEENNGSKILFGSTVVLDFFFEKQQSIKCQIYQEKELISTKEFFLHSFMSNKNFHLDDKIYNIDSNEYIGKINLDLKEIPKDNKLKNTISEFSEIKIEFNESDNEEKFFILKNFNDGKNWRACFKSREFIPINKSYIYRDLKLDTNILCKSEEQEILIEIYKIYETYPSSIAYFTLNNINKQILIKNNSTKNQKILGQIIIKHKLVKKKRFLDYLKEGMDINLTIAIDYTESNGIQNNRESLHYAFGNESNDYEKAIYSCGKILAFYDKDQIFPVYGFGGIPPNEKENNDCFNINLTDNPNIQTLEEVIKIYKESLSKITFKGPTHFAPIIKKVMDNIQFIIENKSINYYEILMILTDGIINDMKETLKLIVDCSLLPLSIIIIGIGNSHFDDMKILDGDEIPLTDFDDRVSKRDLVQFVEYEKFKQKNNNEELADEVLKEIPKQVEEYYAMTGNFKFQNNN